MSTASRQILIDRSDKVITSAIANFYGRLQGEKFNLGQGNETEGAPKTIIPVTFGVSRHHVYRKGGGLDIARETSARFVSDHFGVFAGLKNTFVLDMTGRAALEFSRSFSNTLTPHEAYDDYMARLHWGAYDQQTALQRGKAVFFENPGLESVPNFYEQLESNIRTARSFILDDPGNPLGAQLQLEWLRNASDMFDQANRKKQNGKFVVIIDAPYAYAFDQAPPGTGHYFNSGFNYIASPDAVTPWIAIFSLSKSLGFATPGATIVAVHPAIAEDFLSYLSATVGISYSEERQADLAKALSREKYPEHRAHYGKLADKYHTNFAYTDSRADVYPGCGPAMTMVIKGKDLIGKEVDVAGEPVVIKDKIDVAQAIGNKTGVAIVPQGQEGNTTLIRVVNALPPNLYAPAIDKLIPCIKEIEAAPRPRGETVSMHIKPLEQRLTI